jgi:hypothetical protein
MVSCPPAELNIGSREHGNEQVGTIKGTEFHD